MSGWWGVALVYLGCAVWLIAACIGAQHRPLTRRELEVLREQQRRDE